jgi:hypothetical protein
MISKANKVGRPYNRAMTDNNPQRKPATDEERQKSLERWHAYLHEDQQNQNAKETFDEITERAAKPEKSESEKPAQSDSYNGK